MGKNYLGKSKEEIKSKISFIKPDMVTVVSSCLGLLAEG